jgi:hypothetical protein
MVSPCVGVLPGGSGHVWPWCNLFHHISTYESLCAIGERRLVHNRPFFSPPQERLLLPPGWEGVPFVAPAPSVAAVGRPCTGMPWPLPGRVPCHLPSQVPYGSPSCCVALTA